MRQWLKWLAEHREISERTAQLSQGFELTEEIEHALRSSFAKVLE